MAAQGLPPHGFRPGPDDRLGGVRSNLIRPEKRLTMPQIRLLPVTIFVAGLMLTVRLTDIWKDITALPLPTVSVNESEAQQPPQPGGRKRGQQRAQPNGEAPPATTAAAAPASPSAGAPSTTTGAPGAAPAPVSSAVNPPPAVPSSTPSEGEPPTFTQNELDVLQKLAERREALDARERDLSLRENLVKAAEARIDKKIGEMKALQSSVESMLKQVDEQDDGKMKSLVKIYETMKPKDAAKIFEQLDMPILLAVIQRMKEAKIAPIMEVMDPMKAKTITDAMAYRRGAKTEGQGG